jgi:Signal peptide peptidase
VLAHTNFFLSLLLHPGARYGFEGNETSGQVIYPIPQWDYDCSMGLNIINESLPLDPPAYNGTVMDPLMDMTRTETTICTLEDGRQPCDSQLCLVLSRIPNTTLYPVCCAWDVPLTMPSSDDIGEGDTSDIVAVFLTIRQGQEMMKSNLLGRQVVIESRGKAFNVSYLFMWVLGTLVVSGASWYAAGDYHRFGIKLAAYREKVSRALHNRNSRTPISPEPVAGHRHTNRSNNLHADQQHLSRSSRRHDPNFANNNSGQSAERDDQRRNTDPKPDVESAYGDYYDETNDTKSRKKKKSKKVANKQHPNHQKKRNVKDQEEVSLHSIPPRRNKKKDGEESRPVFSINFGRRDNDNVANGVDTNTRRAPSRAVNNNNTDIGDDPELPELPARESARMKAFEMNQWHVLIFIVTASLLLILLFFFQFYTIIFVIYGIGCAGAISYLVFNPFVTWFFPKFGDEVVEELNKKVICGLNGFDVMSQLAAYVWAAIWLWFGITKYLPETNAFFWLTMDVFGICFCILTASLLKLNSIKIATLLMVAIFIYDIFFVFITPFITGGDSIMLTVAGGGGGATGWEDYCYRYQDDRDCKGINFLPMLLMLPKVNDFANRAVILGLGDIILPGFLLAFCARHDEACRLVDANMTNTGVDVPHKWYQGFFFPMVVAYCIGLLIAFGAVLAMEQGQPGMSCPLCEALWWNL